MNTLLKTISEKYGARSTGEKQFIDAHKIEKVADRNGNKDDVFNGNVKKAPARRADQKNVDSTSVDHEDPVMKRFYDIWGASGRNDSDPKVNEMADSDWPTHRVQFTKGKMVGARQHHYEEVAADNEDEAVAKAKKRFNEPGYRISHVHTYENTLGEHWINFADGTSVQPDKEVYEAIQQVRESLDDQNRAKFDMMLHADITSYEKALGFVMESIQNDQLTEMESLFPGASSPDESKRMGDALSAQNDQYRKDTKAKTLERAKKRRNMDPKEEHWKHLDNALASLHTIEHHADKQSKNSKIQWKHVDHMQSLANHLGDLVKRLGDGTKKVYG